MNGACRNVRTKEYMKMLARLPSRVQNLAAQPFEHFRNNPDYPSLRRHQLEDNDKGQHHAGSYSVSVTKQYRALYFEDGGTIVWYWISGHS